jgi:hypothetical protein
MGDLTVFWRRLAKATVNLNGADEIDGSIAREAGDG